MKRTLAYFYILIGILACSGPNEKDLAKNCKYGSPSPIFHDSLQTVESHEFKAEQYESIEQIVFSNSLQLNIFQSGCNSIKQDFHFIYPGNFDGQTLEFWLKEAVNQFSTLSTLHPDFMVFQFWAQAISEKSTAIKRAELIELEAGFHFKIDWVTSEQDANLMLTLSKND